MVLVRRVAGSHGCGANRDQELSKEAHGGETSIEREKDSEAVCSPMTWIGMCKCLSLCTLELPLEVTSEPEWMVRNAPFCRLLIPSESIGTLNQLQGYTNHGRSFLQVYWFYETHSRIIYAS